MATSSKRRWFRIHLSTAMALVVCASLLVSLNFVPHQMLPEYDGAPSFGEMYGWPHVFFFTVAHWYTDLLTSTGKQIVYDLDVINYDGHQITLRYLALDLVVLLAILAAIAIACEFSIRRKAATR